MSRTCIMCRTDQAIPHELLCGMCDEGIETLKGLGWNVTPPKVKEDRTHQAQLYRRYGMKPRTTAHV